MIAEANYVIRPFQSADLPQCQSLYRQVMLTYQNPLSTIEKTIRTDMADIQSTYMNVEGGHWWVAVQGDRGTFRKDLPLIVTSLLCCMCGIPCANGDSEKQLLTKVTNGTSIKKEEPKFLSCFSCSMAPFHKI